MQKLSKTQLCNTASLVFAVLCIGTHHLQVKGKSIIVEGPQTDPPDVRNTLDKFYTPGEEGNVKILPFKLHLNMLKKNQKNKKQSLLSLRSH